MFKPGDEVICINDSEPPQAPPNVVVLNQTYTVTGVETRFHPVQRFGPAVMFAPLQFLFLAEVPSPKNIGFFAFRFRKVEKKSRATDISVFKEIVDGTRVVPLEPDIPVRKKEKA